MRIDRRCKVKTGVESKCVCLWRVVCNLARGKTNEKSGKCSVGVTYFITCKGGPLPGGDQQQIVGVHQAAGSGHQVHARLAGGQRGVREVARLVVVVLHIQGRQFAVVDAQGAAAVVDVLSVQQRLGVLGRVGVRILDQGLGAGEG